MNRALGFGLICLLLIAPPCLATGDSDGPSLIDRTFIDDVMSELLSWVQGLFISNIENSSDRAEQAPDATGGASGNLDPPAPGQGPTTGPEDEPNGGPEIGPGMEPIG